MKQKAILAAVAGLAMLLGSCSGGLGKLSPDHFTVTPSLLEANGGKVPVTISGRFPEKFMNRKAVVTVTPTLRSIDGSVSINGDAASFQGEKVLGNNQEISYRLGGNYTMRTSFDYQPALQQSELYLNFDAQVGKKKVSIPAVKVADGVIATSELLARTVNTTNGEIAPDAYQYAIDQRQDANIKYLIQQANIRTSELKTTSVQDFLKMLRDIKSDQKGYALDHVDISAYASPDGGIDLNTKLAEQRQKSSEDYVKSQLRALDINADVNARYTAEDWEGFQELVSKSNIQDKDIILRVLSMYSDPEEREQQIHNLSAAFQELAGEVLPELRRARLTINYLVIGRSDDEILEQANTNPAKLSIEELLYGATLDEGDGELATKLYRTAAKEHPTDYRAWNNLAQMDLARGDINSAKQWLEKAAAVNNNAAEVKLNQALIALREGKAADAEGLLAQATTAERYNEVLGNLLVAQGRYAQAAQSLNGVKSNSAALAQLLNKDYSAAMQTIAQIEKPDATTSYLKAIVAARTNQTGMALEALSKAFEADPSLKARAARDLEFITIFNDTDFQRIVR